MNQTRRDFLLTIGAAGAGLSALGAQDVFWTTEEIPDVGWAPGIEERLNSACLICPSRCGIQGRVVDGSLVRIVGNTLHPLSRGGLCPRGLAGVQMLYHPERLASPLVRVGSRGEGEWRSLPPEQAISLLAERLQTIRGNGRPESLAVVAGYCAGTVEDLWRQFFQAFGSPNYVSDAYEDGTDSIMSLMHGIPARPSFDLDGSDLVVSFGASLFESWWSPLQAFVAYAPPGVGGDERPRFIQVDTRFSRTAARAQEWVGVRPGSYAVLAMGLAYVLIRDQLYDDSFVREHVSGFEDFPDEQGRLREGYRSLVMRNYRTEEVSEATGVPVERITSLARSFAESGRSVAVFGPDVTQAPGGLLAGMAVHSLNILMGHVNRPGGILFGDSPPLTPLVPPVLDETARAGSQRPRIGRAPPAFGRGTQALRFAEAIAGAAPSTEVEALLLYYANPLASSSHPEVWRHALEQIPFIVSFSPFLDETALHADLIIPDLLPFERWQDAPAPDSYPYPVWAVAQPMVEPHEGGTHTGDVVLDLAARLGGTVGESLPYDDFLTLLRTRAQGLFSAGHGMVLGSEFEQRHHRQMEERGWWLPEHSEFEPFWEDLVQRGGWTDLYYDETDPARLAWTPNGQIELMPSSLLRALDGEGRGQVPYVFDRTQDVVSVNGFPLRLMPYRVSTLASGTLTLQRWLAEQPSILPDILWTPWVEVSPATAAELGFHDGETVWVVAARGRYRARLKASLGTAPGNVGAPYGLRHPDGELANPLQLLDGSSDPFTGLPSWSTTFVRLERA
jgi:anaerobic selenocysteine-containing dehydrogenase